MAVALQLPQHDLPHHHSLQLRPTNMEQAKITRPSLPSISSLIEAVNDQVEAGKETSPKAERPRRTSSASPGQPAGSPGKLSLAGSPRNNQPPTPELPPASSFDFPHSADGSISPASAATRPSLYPPTTSSTKPELYAQRNSSYPAIPDASSSYPPIPDTHQWGPASQQGRSPTGLVSHDTSRQPPIQQVEPPPDAAQQLGLAQQRPLPGNFPPPLAGQPLPPIDPQMVPTWQHHHYYPPANPPSYPQTQERYICPTCNKPFSRPSSLKIHTYSHTGEKPYKCKHEGCGKHFSVRSNMKRHEKGCHGGESASASGSSPKTN